MAQPASDPRPPVEPTLQPPPIPPISQATLDTVHQAGHPSPPPAAPPARAVRFRKVRSHAKGGLGEVFIAADDELQRAIALKEIQPRHADDGASRQRFVQEALVTGRLEP